MVELIIIVTILLTALCICNFVLFLLNERDIKRNCSQIARNTRAVSRAYSDMERTVSYMEKIVDVLTRKER